MEASDPKCMVEAWAAYLRQKTEKLEACLDAALATGDVEAIHGLRVNSRRLDEPLRVMAASLPRREVKPARNGLKDIRRAFRRVRDLDVFIHSLASVPSGPDATQTELAELESHLSHRRAAALADAVRRCRKLRPTVTLKLLAGIARASSAMSDREGELAAELERRLQRLAHSLAQGETQTVGEVDLHAARIRVKRLRYGIELAERIGARPPSPLVDALVSMQDLLGRWNDDVTAARRLARLACRDDLPARRSESGARLLELAAWRARAAAAQRRKIDAAWTGLSTTLNESFDVHGGPGRPSEADVVKDEPVHVF